MGKKRKEKIAESAAYWVSYYRHNPTRFVADYLHINLKWHQKILITMMCRCRHK